MRNEPKPMRRSPTIRRQSQRGTAVIEFSLVTLTMFVPLLLVSIVLGLNLGRSIQATQVARDAGSMYMRGVDFSLSDNKLLIQRLANGLNMTTTGGNGVVILSTVTFIPASTCAPILPSPCNSDKYVLTERITIGNSGLRTSNFATSGTVSQDASGNVLNYMTDPNAVLSTFGTSVMTLSSGEYCYVSEAYFSSPDFDMPGTASGTGVYRRAIY